MTESIIGGAIEVHKELGPGLMESAYDMCLARELSLAGIAFRSQWPLPIDYKGVHLDCGYRLDFLVDDRLIIETKSVAKLLPIHDAQILTYMKLAQVGIGLLMNFNVRLLKDGIKRFVL